MLAPSSRAWSSIGPMMFDSIPVSTFTGASGEDSVVPCIPSTYRSGHPSISPSSQFVCACTGARPPTPAMTAAVVTVIARTLLPEHFMSLPPEQPFPDASSHPCLFRDGIVGSPIRCKTAFGECN